MTRTHITVKVAGPDGTNHVELTGDDMDPAGLLMAVVAAWCAQGGQAVVMHTRHPRADKAMPAKRRRSRATDKRPVVLPDRPSRRRPERLTPEQPAAIVIDLGPMRRRRFDPEAARARAASATGGRGMDD